MGRVINYTDKVKQGRKVPPSAEPSSVRASELPEATRGENIKDTVGTWTEEDLNLHKLLLLDLMQKEEFAQARIVAQHLTDLQPEEPYVWYLRGVALLESSDPRQAESCLLKSMEIQGTDAADCYQMSRARLLQGDLEGAGDWCHRALEMDPEKLGLHWLMMKIHSLRGDIDAAIAVGKKALPKSEDVSDEVATRLKLANLFLSKPAFDEAVEQLRKAMKMTPNNSELWSLLGHCLCRQHKTKASLKAFQRAVEIDPSSADDLYNIGDAYLGLEQPDKAIKPLLQAIRLKDNYRLAHYNLSVAYIGLKKYREAEMSARAALCDDPEMEFQASNLGMGATGNLGLALLNQGKTNEAEACFRRNLHLLAPTYTNLGLLLFRNKRYGEALENYKRALELEPDDPECNNLVGDTYGELGRLDEAEKFLRRAVELDKNYALGHYDLGVFLSGKRGQKAKALEAFEQALKIQPDMVQAHYGIACAHALEQEEALALEALGTALKNGFREFDHIEKDTDWDSFRKNTRFTRLLEKYRNTEKITRIAPVTIRKTYRTNQKSSRLKNGKE